MTSSGTYGFASSNGSIVLSAFERIQIRSPSLRQEHLNTARNELNYLFVQLSNLQPNLWKVQQNSIPLVSGTASYSVPANVVMILDAWVTVNSGTQQATDLYVTPISRTEYASLSSKTTPGRSTVFWFDRTITPVLYPWPVPDSSGPYVFNYFACLQMQDANLPGGETPDIPYRWIDALVAGLAHRLARVYSPQLESVRKTDAMEAWQVAATQDTENVDLVLSPNLGGYYRY